MKRIEEIKPSEWSWELEEKYQQAEELLQHVDKDKLIEWFLGHLTEKELDTLLSSME
jgi:hypothetical protein